MQIDWPKTIEKFDAILARGLCKGVGTADGQMCIEAAITQALDLPFNDDPECVARSVREYKIALNDSPHWINPESRAKGLRSLGIAQIGSKGVVDDVEFTKRLAEKTIRILLPKLFRQYLSEYPNCLIAAARCEKEGTAEAAGAAARAAEAAGAAKAAGAAWAAWAAGWAAWAAGWAAEAAEAAGAARAAGAAARAAARAARAARAAGAAWAAAETWLVLSADLALEVLRELNSPGCEWV
jgi:hypothetical protein